MSPNLAKYRGIHIFLTCVQVKGNPNHPEIYREAPKEILCKICPSPGTGLPQFAQEHGGVQEINIFKNLSKRRSPGKCTFSPKFVEAQGERGVYENLDLAKICFNAQENRDFPEIWRSTGRVRGKSTFSWDLRKYKDGVQENPDPRSLSTSTKIKILLNLPKYREGSRKMHISLKFA